MKGSFRGKIIDFEALNERGIGTMAHFLEMKVISCTENTLTMQMPVNEKTVQPMQILNGGASLALAETVGSMAGNLCLDASQACVGLDINGNHLKSAPIGTYVYATASAIHIGKSTHVWQIDIKNDKQEMICICRLTLIVINKNK